MKCNSKGHSRLLIFLCVFDVVKIMQRAKGGGAQSSPPPKSTWNFNRGFSSPWAPSPLHHWVLININQQFKRICYLYNYSVSCLVFEIDLLWSKAACIPPSWICIRYAYVTSRVKSEIFILQTTCYYQYETRFFSILN
jgi:hypothetical protein